MEEDANTHNLNASTSHTTPPVTEEFAAGPSTSRAHLGPHSSPYAMEYASTSSTPIFVDDFLSTGRTGRRNALGDILDDNSAFLSTADLPDQLQALSFAPDECQPSTSGFCSSAASASKQSSEPDNS